MKELIQRNLSGRKVLLLFIFTNIIYAFMLMISIPKVMNFSGGMKFLDMMPLGYNAEYVNSLLNTLGEKGRHIYLYNQIPVDMIYPFFFGISYCLVLAYILNKLGKLNNYLFYLCLLPLFAGLFDYFENFGIITMLKSYPGNSILLSQITNIFSVLKSSFTIIYFITLIIFLLVFGINKLFKKKGSS